MWPVYLLPVPRAAGISSRLEYCSHTVVYSRNRDDYRIGHMGLATLGTMAVLAANLLLRPIAQRINRAPLLAAAEELVVYLFECVRRTSDEAQIRALLVQYIGGKPLLLFALHSEDQEGTNRVKVRAHLKSMGRKDELLEQIVTRLSLEPGVTTIRWEIVSASDSALGGVP